MGEYTTRPLEEKELKDIIESIAAGYTDHKGIIHKPNKQVATILTLQANLGCRIGDICNLTTENFVFDGDAWKLDMTEQKTGKKRYFIVPKPVKAFIDRWTHENGITQGNLFSIKEYAVWKQLRGVTDYLELENVSAHSMRKTAALRIYNASGKDIALTSQFLNHSSPRITATYLKRSSKQMDDIISKSVCLL